MGEEVPENLPVLPPDDWRAHQGGAGRAPTPTLPPGGASHLTDGV